MSNRFNRKRLIVNKPKVCTKPPDPPIVPPGNGPLFWDQYIDTAGTPLENHTPDIDKVGGGWLQLHGGYTVQYDFAQITGPSAIPRHIYGADVAEQWIIMKCLFNTGTDPNRTMGVIWNYAAWDTFMQADIYTAGRLMRILTRHPGHWHNQIQWFEASIGTSTDFLLTVSVNPANVSLQLDALAPHVWANPQPNVSGIMGINAHDSMSIKHLDLETTKWE